MLDFVGAYHSVLYLTEDVRSTPVFCILGVFGNPNIITENETIVRDNTMDQARRETPKTWRL